MNNEHLIKILNPYNDDYVVLPSIRLTIDFAGCPPIKWVAKIGFYV